MLHNIYAPLSGAINQEKVLDIIANNLANLNTTGFKGEQVSFTLLDSEPEKSYAEPFPPAQFKPNMEEVFPLRGNDMQYTGIAQVSKDFSQGPAVKTDNPSHLMIEGEGFFSVMTADGMRYTRDGSLTLNDQGYLVTQAGDTVLGEKGAINITGTFEVNHKGEIYQQGQLVDRLLLNQVKDLESLERVGNNYYFYNGSPEDILKSNNPQIKQGFLEGSNVNAIKNLTAMILAHRSYEAYQKAVSNYDQILEKSSNRLGEIRA